MSHDGFVEEKFCKTNLIVYPGKNTSIFYVIHLNSYKCNVRKLQCTKFCWNLALYLPKVNSKWINNKQILQIYFQGKLSWKNGILVHHCLLELNPFIGDPELTVKSLLRKLVTAVATAWKKNWLEHWTELLGKFGEFKQGALIHSQMQLDVAEHKEDRPCQSHKGFIAWKEIALKRFAAQSWYAGECVRIQDDAVELKELKN